MMSRCVLGGYKGYGLGMLVEIFCGIMGGGSWGPNVRRWMSTDAEANLVIANNENNVNRLGAVYRILILV